METIPDRTSNGGPETRDSENDWRDWLYVARENFEAAQRMEVNITTHGVLSQRDRLNAIDKGIEAAQEARKLLASAGPGRLASCPI